MNIIFLFQHPSVTGRCLKHSCNKHWCDGTAFGFNNDTLYVGFSSTFRDLSADSPSVDVNFYRNESGKWHQTASETFANNEEKVVHLMGLIVHDSSSTARHKRDAGKSSQWEYVTLKAKISKTTDKVLYQVIIYFCIFKCSQCFTMKALLRTQCLNPNTGVDFCTFNHYCGKSRS